MNRSKATVTVTRTVHQDIEVTVEYEGHKTDEEIRRMALDVASNEDFSGREKEAVYSADDITRL